MLLPATVLLTLLTQAPAKAAGEVISNVEIMRVVNSKERNLKECRDLAKKEEPNVRGEVHLRWTITAAGEVKDVSVVLADIRSGDAVRCLENQVKTWRFPAAQRQSEPITMPFKFGPKRHNSDED